MKKYSILSHNHMTRNNLSSTFKNNLIFNFKITSVSPTKNCKMASHINNSRYKIHKNIRISFHIAFQTFAKNNSLQMNYQMTCPKITFRTKHAPKSLNYAQIKAIPPLIRTIPLTLYQSINGGNIFRHFPAISS